MGVLCHFGRNKFPLVDGFSNLDIGIPKRNSLLNEFVQGIYTKYMGVLFIWENITLDLHFFYTRSGHRQTAFDLIDGLHDRPFKQLHFSVVATGQIGTHHRQLVRKRLELVAFSTDEFKHIRVLFVWHDTRSRCDVIWKGDKIKVLTHIQTDIHRKPTQRSSETTNGLCQVFFEFSPTHLCCYNIVFQSVKPERCCGILSVYREGTAVASSTPEWILVTKGVNGIE